MRLLCDSPLSPGWIVTKIRPPALSATFFLKGTFLLKPDEPAAPAAEPDPIDGDGPRYASDSAPFKPKADLLLAATCHAPGGKPVQACRASFHVGGWSKSVAVIGDRVWTAKGLTEPQPFTKMPLSWDRAYGGTGFAPNPVGRGAVEGPARPMPNIEHPDRLIVDPTHRHEPAGFAPLPATAPQRMRKVGTFDKAWLAERWPWFPKDFDFGYFNAAPEDQQLPGYLRGDETLRFENLHPRHADYAARLPGLRARCFVETTSDFREVPLKLDTLWVDMDAEKLVLVWRGTTDVKTIKLKEVTHLLAVTEPLAETPGTVEHYRTVLAERLKEPVEETPPAEEPLDTAADEAEADRAMAEMDEEMARVEKQAADAEARLAREAAEAGVDVKAAPMNLKETQAQFAAALAEMKKEHREMPDVEIEPIPEPEEVEEEPEEEEPVEWTRDLVQAGVAKGLAFAQQDLSGLDLSGLDLSDANFAGAILSKAKLGKTKLVRASIAKADFSEADLTGADLSGARADGADFFEATLPKSIFAGASLHDASFFKANVAGADFSGAAGRGCSFWNANLAGARFRDAKFPATDFCVSQLEKADFTGADLARAQVEGAAGVEIVMEDADLTGLHASDAPDFTRGNFRKVKGAESCWEGAKLAGADFAGSTLTRADFSETVLDGAHLERCDLRGALFADASLKGASLFQANVCRGSFERADLEGADLRGANLFEAEFWDAKADRANLKDANLHGTKLADRS